MKTSIYNIGATTLLIFGIYSYNILSMDEQKEALHKKINDWKGSYEQVDDILILGVRV